MGGELLLDWYAQKTRQLSIEEIRERIENAIDQVYAVLDNPTRRHGAAGKIEVWSLCPFHDDRSVGSFSVNLSNGVYHCFVCGASGGLYGLLSKLLGQEKASELIGDITAESLAMLTDDYTSANKELKPTLQIPESVMAAYSMLPKRLIEQKKHPKSLIEELGIRVDLKSERILFPVRDMQGRLVGVQTRTAVDDNPGKRWQWYDVRWLRRILTAEEIEEWGLGEYTAPRDSVFYLENRSMAGWATGSFDHPVVLMEGMGHCLRCIEAGFSPAGMFGTELGAGQFNRLWKIYSRFGVKLPLIICFDADVPGRHAAYRSAFRLMSIADVKIALLPFIKGKKYDAEDLSPGELRQVLKRAMNVQDILADTDDDEFGYAMEALDQVMSKVAKRRDIRDAKRERMTLKYGQKKYEEVDVTSSPSVVDFRNPTASVGITKSEAFRVLSLITTT